MLAEQSTPERVSDVCGVGKWLEPDALRDRAILKRHACHVADPDADLFEICPSPTVIRSSYQRNGAWKIHRMSEADLKTFGQGR